MGCGRKSGRRVLSTDGRRGDHANPTQKQSILCSVEEEASPRGVKKRVGGGGSKSTCICSGTVHIFGNCFRSSQSEPWNIYNNTLCSTTATACQSVKNSLGAVKAKPFMTSGMQNIGEVIWREKACFHRREYGHRASVVVNMEPAFYGPISHQSRRVYSKSTRCPGQDFASRATSRGARAFSGS